MWCENERLGQILVGHKYTLRALMGVARKDLKCDEVMIPVFFGIFHIILQKMTSSFSDFFMPFPLVDNKTKQHESYGITVSGCIVKNDQDIAR